MRIPLICVGAALVVGAAPDRSPCRMEQAEAAAGTIAYRDCGRGDPVIVIPGGPGLDAGYIAPLARMIADQEHRVILIEPRGTGASRAALGDGSQLTFQGSVADVEAVRRAAGIDHAAILGHSFGGGIAQAYAAAHPDRVTSLLLLDSVGPDMKAPHGPLDGWRRRLPPADLARHDAAKAQGDRWAATKIKFRGSFYHAARGRTFIAGLADAAMHEDVMPLSAAYERDFHLPPLMTARVHVTILAGKIDWIRGYEPALRAAYPNARTIVIPHASHFPWIDAPAATRRALRQALPQ